MSVFSLDIAFACQVVAGLPSHPIGLLVVLAMPVKWAIQLAVHSIVS